MKHFNKVAKRICVFALAAMLPIALSACGGTESPSNQPDQGSGGGSGNTSGTHVYMKDWYYDENTHWRMCAEFTCLMAELRFEEAAHQFTYDEPKVFHSLGETDRISVDKTCEVCAATYTDDSRGDKLYGSFEYPADPSDSPKEYLVQADKINSDPSANNQTNFLEDTTWYCSIEVETAGDLALYEIYYSAGYDNVSFNYYEVAKQGEFHLFDAAQREIEVELRNTKREVRGGGYYTYNNYKVHVEPGTYVLGIRHYEFAMGYKRDTYYKIAYQLSKIAYQLS